MGGVSPGALMTPEQQLRAVQTKAQHARDLPSCVPWCLAGMVATFTGCTSRSLALSSRLGSSAGFGAAGTMSCSRRSKSAGRQVGRA